MLYYKVMVISICFGLFRYFRQLSSAVNIKFNTILEEAYAGCEENQADGENGSV